MKTTEFNELTAKVNAKMGENPYFKRSFAKCLDDVLREDIEDRETRKKLYMTERKTHPSERGWVIHSQELSKYIEEKKSKIKKLRELLLTL